MAKFDVMGSQNVEVSEKLPCEKPLMEQLEIMEEYTRVHREHLGDSKEMREAACLAVLYPRMFRSIEPEDRIAGRLDFLPIGFGAVTSLGGVGHYCVFAKLRAFQEKLVSHLVQKHKNNCSRCGQMLERGGRRSGATSTDDDNADGCISDNYYGYERGGTLDSEDAKKRVDALYDYWLEHDVKTIYCKDVLTDTTIGRFIDCEYPLIATARLSGMMLDYPKLLELGIGGLRQEIREKLELLPENEFALASLKCLDIFSQTADALREKAAGELENCTDEERRKVLTAMVDGLAHIRENTPRTFYEALQLVWLFALLSGCINYGRLDDYLGPYLVEDFKAGRLTEQEAYLYLKSLWTMIENRRTTVNGRIIVGGKGRRNPEAADVFLHIAMKVAKDCRYVEPQFTLRFDESTSEKVWDEALDAIGAGATYPTLYNDDVNVPAVQYGMRLDEKAAQQYVPFGCTEFVIQGESTGTPNTCINLLKLLTIFMNKGIDPMDGQDKSNGYKIPPLDSYDSFEDFYGAYKDFLEGYLDLAAKSQYRSYEIMNQEVSFLFTSILMKDCIGRGKALLDGGVRYLGGTCETYGNINTSDALRAIQKLVFQEKKYTLPQLEEAVLANFEGYGKVRQDCLNAEKYGNDLAAADDLANDFYEFVSKGIRDRGIQMGMQYFLIVISNNQLNTEWGNRTAASPDGRFSGLYMNPANNPQGGADKSGPTAMLNSLVKFNPKYHAGSVQNIKFTPNLFREHRPIIRSLMRTYFRKGGCHLMVTVVNRHELEDAMVHPEKYPNLLVRVSGFSAVFVKLTRNVQEELLSRMLYDEEQFFA